MTKFFDSGIRPPKGGWTYVVGDFRVERYSESDVLAELKKWRKNNGTFTTDEALEEEVWAYWCAKSPERCGGFAQSPARAAALVTGLVPRESKPEWVGGYLWTYLNILGAKWTPGLHDYFLATIDMMTVLIECPVCQSHWRTIVKDRSPVGLKTRIEVCHWINAAHNAVSSQIGKTYYPYDKMVVEFGAPIS